ncbi:MAG: hypothetical protein C0467_02665 [Planctomycetaceae bacterium]|nr:hypothetical protein [Planctomycetaceae bacterium]
MLTWFEDFRSATRRSAPPPLGLACRLACEALEDRTTPTVSMITSNFNGTAIAGGNYLWFNSVAKVSGVGTEPVTIHVTNQTIDFNGTTLNLPDTTLILTPGSTSAGSSFGPGGWTVSAPGSFSGNVFLGGMGWQVPTEGIAGGSVKSITWTGDFTTDTPGISLKWQWSAANYRTFSADASALGVKAVDSNSLDVYKNSDHAGTPENFKSYVTGGARGGGGSNYTGSYSGTASIKPEVVPVVTGTASLSGQLLFLDATQDGFSGYNGATVTLIDAQGNVVASTTTSDTGTGFFQFDSVPAGTYTLSITVPGTWTIQGDTAGSGGGTSFTNTGEDSSGNTVTTIGFTNVVLGNDATATGYSLLIVNF